MAYTITGRKCGTVRFEPKTVGNIQTEQVSMSSKVTSNPIAVSYTHLRAH